MIIKVLVNVVLRIFSKVDCPMALALFKNIPLIIEVKDDPRRINNLIRIVKMNVHTLTAGKSNAHLKTI